MSVRHSKSSIAPISSMTVGCCLPARPPSSSPMPMSGDSIWARASRSNPMSLAPRLDLRQSQSLVMTPQLQQGIRLLALSNLEVEGFIAEEIEKNPLLESSAPEDDGPTLEREAVPEPRTEPASADELLMGGDSSGEASLDVDFAVESFHHDSVAD